MLCHFCNTEMDLGNIYLRKPNWLLGYREQRVYFNSYNQDAKPEIVIENKQNVKGAYCYHCSSVIVSKNNLRDACPKCGEVITTGDYCIRKSTMGRYLKNSYFHLYFSSEKMQKDVRVLEGGFFVRGYYCHECGTLYFESENCIPF